WPRSEASRSNTGQLAQYLAVSDAEAEFGDGLEFALVIRPPDRTVSSRCGRAGPDRESAMAKTCVMRQISKRGDGDPAKRTVPGQCERRQPDAVGMRGRETRVRLVPCRGAA